MTDPGAAGERPGCAVVVPTRDRVGLLAATLDSLARLDPPPSEVIVVSDGSVDGTDALVEGRGLRDRKSVV